jgi:AcrR family transcriptional regulator
MHSFVIDVLDISKIARTSIAYNKLMPVHRDRLTLGVCECILTPVTPPPATRTLSTAAERREAVLEAAGPLFAARGFAGTPTTEIARAAGISHAYLFRLFPTKSELAVAVVERCHARIAEAFSQAAARAEAADEDVLQAMGRAYKELLADRELLLLQLHSQAAAVEDPVLRETARAGFGGLVELVLARSGAASERIGAFFATGMLMNTLAALGARDSDEHWAVVLRSGVSDGDAS